MNLLKQTHFHANITEISLITVCGDIPEKFDSIVIIASVLSAVIVIDFC